MCWSAEVSLHAFVFGLATTMLSSHQGLIDDRTVALCLAVAGMQLVEFVAWTSIRTECPRLNALASAAGLATVLAQPLLAVWRKPRFVVVYIAWLAAYVALSRPIRLRTTVAPSGHLRWDWLRPANGRRTEYLMHEYLIVGWWALFAAGLWPEVPSVVFMTGMLVWAYRKYAAEGTWGSMYCFWSNAMFVEMLWRASLALW